MWSSVTPHNHTRNHDPEVPMDVSAAARAIKRGEVVGVPTDTVYGIAADPFDEAALERLYALKGQPDGLVVGIKR